MLVDEVRNASVLLKREWKGSRQHSQEELPLP